MICKGVRGLRKGSEKRSEVLKEGVVRIGGSVKSVFASINFQ